MGRRKEGERKWIFKKNVIVEEKGIYMDRMLGKKS